MQIKWFPNPSLWNNKTVTKHVSSSTEGYVNDILVLQEAHFPFKKMYDKTGMFWYHLIFVLHFGQEEFGVTIDWFKGSLYISTLKKEPKHNPNRATNI